MTSDHRATFALDLGAATTSAALIAVVDGRRRLLASTSMPAGIDPDDLLGHLLARLGTADPDLAALLGIGPTGGPIALAGAIATWPRLVARSSPPPELVVLATTAREQHAVARLAGLAGWRTAGGSLEVDGAIELTRLGLSRTCAAIAVAAREPGSREETARLTELTALAGGIVERAPGVPMLLVGGAARALGGLPVGENGEGPLLAPGPDAGDPPGEPLRRLLLRLDPASKAARRAMVATTIDLAIALDRRIELVEIGFDGGLRAVVGPGGVEALPAFLPEAALVPTDLDEIVIDEVLAWSTLALDRHRMGDRLRELRLWPWVDAHGEGALLRLAAARAALERLVRATPELSALPAPDVIVVAGGAWSAAPGPAIALALADLVRRPGASQLAFDHARLLGPLGTIEDADARLALVGELADDLLTPLGTVIMPQGMRPGRSAGQLVVRSSAGETELELAAGDLRLVDLPPGQLAMAELHFRDPVQLGTRVRQVRIEVAGGLGGLLIDTRDIPLRLPERAEPRRALLHSWQAAFWAGLDG